MIDEHHMTLGRDWSGEDPAGWFLSEKLFDVRAFWDGEHFWTRGGNMITVPDRIRRAVPAGVMLDGGIYAGRDGCEEARVAVQFNKWTRRCRFVAYDCPRASGDWPARMAAASRFTRNVIPFTVCEGREHLLESLKRIHEASGEGIVIRHPAVTVYETGRTANLLKVKTPNH